MSLTQYRVTVDPKSPAVTLFSPSGAPNPYYAEFGWVGASGADAKLPNADDRLEAGRPQHADGRRRPVTLTWDNGEGLDFRRTIAIDDNYLFTIKDEVKNNGAAPVTLYPLCADLAPRHAARSRASTSCTKA